MIFYVFPSKQTTSKQQHNDIESYANNKNYVKCSATRVTRVQIDHNISKWHQDEPRNENETFIDELHRIHNDVSKGSNLHDNEHHPERKHEPDENLDCIEVRQEHKDEGKDHAPSQEHEYVKHR